MSDYDLMMCDEFDYWNSNEGISARKRACDLIRKEDDNLLLELPVPFGTTVWWINEKNNDVVEVQFSKCDIGLWGIRTFKTKEEAEKKALSYESSKDDCSNKHFCNYRKV